MHQKNVSAREISLKSILNLQTSADNVSMGKISFLAISIVLSLSILGCTATKNSLLTDWHATDPCETTDCISRQSSESDLFVQPTLSTKSIKSGTLVAEVDGKCSASFYAEHKIVVRVFQGTGATPVPMADNDSYIVSTNGHMLTDVGKFYPQCIRGKFSFLVPLFNPASPLTPMTSVYVQFYMMAMDSARGEVISPIASTLVNIHQ